MVRFATGTVVVDWRCRIHRADPYVAASTAPRSDGREAPMTAVVGSCPHCRGWGSARSCVCQVAVVARSSAGCSGRTGLIDAGVWQKLYCKLLDPLTRLSPAARRSLARKCQLFSAPSQRAYMVLARCAARDEPSGPAAGLPTRSAPWWRVSCHVDPPPSPR